MKRFFSLEAGGSAMNEKGHSLLENLLFFSAVLLIINYLLIITGYIERIEQYEINQDQIYEEAHQ